MPWLEKMSRQIRDADGDQRDNDDHGGQGKCDGQTSGMFWPEPIDETKDEQDADSGKADMVFEKFQPENASVPAIT